MSDVKKFLDQQGTSLLWAKIKSEVKKVDEKAVQNASDIVTMKGQIAALEAGTYDDSEVRELITSNTTAIGVNTAAIALLNSDAETTGSVAHTATTVAATKVAEIVAGADADFDTLKEIADWILNDTTGAADMANDIAALQAQMAGIDETVVKSIAAAIDEALKVEGANKYALAADLTDLANRVKALEDAGYLNETAVNAAIESKITALKLDETYEAKGAAAAAENAAKSYADGLFAGADTKGSAAAAEAAAKAYSDTNLEAAKAYSDANLVTAKAYTDANLITAKSYTDTEFGKIQVLSETEIDEIIASANATV